MANETRDAQVGTLGKPSALEELARQEVEERDRRKNNEAKRDEQREQEKKGELVMVRATKPGFYVGLRSIGEEFAVPPALLEDSTWFGRIEEVKDVVDNTPPNHPKLLGPITDERVKKSFPDAKADDVRLMQAAGNEPIPEVWPHTGSAEGPGVNAKDAAKDNKNRTDAKGRQEPRNRNDQTTFAEGAKSTNADLV